MSTALYFPDEAHPVSVPVGEVTKTFVFYLNPDWSDTCTSNILTCTPEIGMPITRKRSRNVRHRISATLTLSYEEFAYGFAKFLSDIKSGFLSFNIMSPVDSLYHEAYMDTGSSCYTVARNNNTTYTVSFTFSYVEARMV